jgi:hypothetical protein
MADAGTRQSVAVPVRTDAQRKPWRYKVSVRCRA